MELEEILFPFAIQARFQFMLKKTSTNQQIHFHFKWLVLFIHLGLFISPLTSISQSRTYQLSNKTDSLIQFLSKDLVVPDRVLFLENLKNEKSEIKIGKLQSQLDIVGGDERLEMELNERLGRESKWAGKVTEAYQFYTRTLYWQRNLRTIKR